VHAHENTRNQYNILIVDPDAEFADMVAQAARDAGGPYTVTIDTDIRAARAHLQESRGGQSPFDLLFVDVRTPGTGGMRLVEELTQSYPTLKIVTMTAYHSPELAAHVLQLHVHRHMVKPIAPSEIRKLVQETLAGNRAETARILAPLPLSDQQQAAVERQLANLRRATGSVAALLLHTSGTIRAMDGLDQNLDTNALCQALLGAQRSISQALTQVFQTQDPVRQSYFGTLSYSICVHRLDEVHAVATVFGPEVREGQVWYAMREGIEALQTALEAREQASSPSHGPARSHGVDMVQEYFEQQQEASQARSGRRTRERASEPPPVQARARAQASPPSVPSGRAAPAAPEPDTPSANPGPAPLPPPLKMERLQLDKIDWELGEPQDWDTLVADTDQGFRGMSFEEAKKRGLLDDLDADD
jgi:CheY-like chemotaxis protein